LGGRTTIATRRRLGSGSPPTAAFEAIHSAQHPGQRYDYENGDGDLFSKAGSNSADEEVLDKMHEVMLADVD
jgi:hypothetical protein